METLRALLVLCLTFPALAGASSLEHRNLRQQTFILEYLKAHPAAPFASTAEIDAFLRPLQAAWEKEAGADPVLARLNPYALMWTLAMVFETKEPSWARCHVWAEHAVPAFLADFDFVRREPAPDKAFLFRLSELNWSLDTAFSCELPTERWTALKVALLAYPETAEGYRARLPRPELEADLRRVAGYARLQAPLLEARTPCTRVGSARPPRSSPRPSPQRRTLTFSSPSPGGWPCAGARPATPLRLWTCSTSSPARPRRRTCRATC